MSTFNIVSGLQYSSTQHTYFHFWGSTKLRGNSREPGVTTISLTDEEILNSTGEEQQKEDEEEEQSDDVVPPSIQQALDAATLLEKYSLFLMIPGHGKNP